MSVTIGPTIELLEKSFFELVIIVKVSLAILIFAIIWRLFLCSREAVFAWKRNASVMLFTAIGFILSWFSPWDLYFDSGNALFKHINLLGFLSLGIGALFLSFDLNIGKEHDSNEDSEVEELFQHRKKLLDSLVSSITQSNAMCETRVIGLFGSWGSGKTFFVKKLFQRLKGIEKRNFFVHYFNPLRFPDGDMVVSIFLHNIKSEYEQFVDGNWIDFEDYLSILNVAEKPFYKKIFGGLLSNSRSNNTEEVVDRINSIIHSKGIRGVVIIDEMDRLKPDELIRMLKVVRSTTLFNGLTVVCCLDYTYAKTCVEKSGIDNSDEYLQKFFTSSIVLPVDLKLEIQRELTLGLNGFLEDGLLKDNDFGPIMNEVNGLFNPNNAVFVIHQGSISHFYGEIIFKHRRGVEKFLTDFTIDLQKSDKVHLHKVFLFRVNLLKLIAPDLLMRIVRDKNNFEIIGDEDFMPGKLEIKNLIGLDILKAYEGSQREAICYLLESMFGSNVPFVKGGLNDLNSLHYYLNTDLGGEISETEIKQLIIERIDISDRPQIFVDAVFNELCRWQIWENLNVELSTSLDWIEINSSLLSNKIVYRAITSWGTYNERFDLINGFIKYISDKPDSIIADEILNYTVQYFILRRNSDETKKLGVNLAKCMEELNASAKTLDLLRHYKLLYSEKDKEIDSLFSKGLEIWLSNNKFRFLVHYLLVPNEGKEILVGRFFKDVITDFEMSIDPKQIFMDLSNSYKNQFRKLFEKLENDIFNDFSYENRCFIKRGEYLEFIELRKLFEI